MRSGSAPTALSTSASHLCAARCHRHVSHKVLHKTQPCSQHWQHPFAVHCTSWLGTRLLTKASTCNPVIEKLLLRADGEGNTYRGTLSSLIPFEQRHKGIEEHICSDVREVVSELLPLSISEPASFLLFSDSLTGHQDSTLWILKYLCIYHPLRKSQRHLFTLKMVHARLFPTENGTFSKDILFFG